MTPPAKFIERDWLMVASGTVNVDPFRVWHILYAVGTHFKIRKNDLLAPRRNREVFGPRAVACALMRDLTNLSYPQIGKRLNRDHGSVLNAIRRVNERPELQRHFLQLKARLI